MAEIRWSLTPEGDLQEIEEYIARDSVLHAVNFIDRLVESTEHGIAGHSEDLLIFPQLVVAAFGEELYASGR